MNLAQHFQGTTAPSAVTEADLNTESFESTMVEVLETEQEMKEINDVVEGFQEVSEGLESYIDALSVTQESGEIDQTTASWILAAGESITSRIGVKLNSVSVESFASPSEASDAVELVSLEASDTLQKLIDTLKKWMAKARETIKKLWVKYTEGGAKLAKAGEALGKKAGDTKGKPESKALEVSYLDKLHIEGKTPSASDLKSAVANVANVAEDVLANSDKAAKEVFEAYKKYLSAAKEGNDQSGELTKALAAFSTSFGQLNKNASVPKTLKVSEGANVSLSNELPGGRVVYAAAAGKNADLAAAISAFDTGMGNTFEGDVDSKGEIEPMSASDVKEIAGEITKVGKAVSEFNKSFQDRDKMKSDLDKLLDDVEKDIKKNDEMEAEQKNRLKTAINAARSVTLVLDQPATAYASYALTTMGAVQNLAKASLKDHKE